MRVQSEIARRANLNPDGKRRVYSSKYALSGMVYCGHCGDIYRKVKWNNRGCKSTVWRCVSRVLKGKMDFDCPARTVKEDVLQGAVVTAVNDAYARKNIVTAGLKQNIESTVFGDLEERLAMADKELADLQAKMIAVSGDEAAIDALGEQIDGLRAERQSILAEAAERSDLQERMNDMIYFLDEMPTMLTEYSDAITRRLVEKITIFDEKIVVELKSGLCCMENKSDKPICVTLKGSSLRRHLVAGEKIWALKMHEKIVAFLPRMAVASKCIHIQTASGIQIRYLNRVEQLPQQASVLAIGEGGRLFVDEKGSISNEYSTGVFQNIMIGEKRAVCWGRCCIRSYGLLFSDGSFFGSQAYPNWDRLLGFDITSRQRIAILSDRTAVDKDGKILGRNVAAVSCCGDRYLLLMADGSVQSDKGKCAIKERILAICAARDYWIATEQCVYQYSQQMEEICTFPHRIDELECDDTGRNVFARLADGRYVKLA